MTERCGRGLALQGLERLPVRVNAQPRPVVAVAPAFRQADGPAVESEPLEPGEHG
jgi:hypothetical protein